MNQKKIGNFMRALRIEHGLTQEKAAEHFGVAGRTVSRWENGINMPDISLLVEIADFYTNQLEQLMNARKMVEIIRAKNLIKNG